ncbi:hypothetical protein SAMN06264364_13840 [Quadrisphaera granulorum]|uniref:Uncharacterized protein n=1 Tax=Quadrisphaera granulorum TaxID=317664 RepID=A0A315ZPB0_9ACTN|nr:hypothetical protein [Quadrisphaera granulorum]PWJ47391.1 hypothetical protein BXY45_13840 [Quadrisphaera granulorum]SZE98838.1 hypothetical protein SAMN06264364_13840 [Quadrisphaera granulorum]
MTRHVALAAVTSGGQMLTMLMTTGEILAIVQEHLALMEVQGREHAAMLDRLVLEHVISDHEDRSPMSHWPVMTELVDVTLAECLGHEHVSTTWPCQTIY